MILYFQEVL